MKKKNIIIAVAVVIALGVIFSLLWTISNKRGGEIPRAAEKNILRGTANVTSIEIILLESFPIQVRVLAKGELPDTCTDLDTIKSRKEGDSFFVSITTARFKDAVCAQVVTPFEQHIPLNVEGLPQGVYTVDVNGVTDTFEFSVDNILRP